MTTSLSSRIKCRATAPAFLKQPASTVAAFVMVDKRDPFGGGRISRSTGADVRKLAGDSEKKPLPSLRLRATGTFMARPNAVAPSPVGNGYTDIPCSIARLQEVEKERTSTMTTASLPCFAAGSPQLQINEHSERAPYALRSYFSRCQVGSMDARIKSEGDR